LSAAVSAFAGPMINGRSFSVGSLMMNTTLGGLASIAGGGKFANGAVTAAFGYLFNGAMGRAVGGTIGGWVIEAAGVETGPFDIALIALGHLAGGEIGSIIEDIFASNPAALPAPNLQDHHIFPQQFDDYFKQRGIDIDDYTVTLGQTQHLQGVHGR